MANRYLIIVLILVLTSLKSFSQLSFLPNDISKNSTDLPRNIKKVIQSLDNKVYNIREYDTLENAIFTYYIQEVGESWNGRFIYMLTGNCYNSENRLLKSYNLHSNVGFSISYYEYDTVNRIESEYIIKKSNTIDSLINKNPYMYISEIQSFSDLMEFDEILNLEKSEIRKLIRKAYYDEENKIIKSIAFNEKLDTALITSYYYNEIGDITHIVEYSKDNMFRCNPYETFYNYLDKNKVVILEIGHDYQNNVLDTIEIKVHKTNQQKQLINKFSLISDYFHNGNRKFEFSKVSYKYNEKGMLVERINSRTYPLDRFKPDEKEKLFSKEEYEYNVEGYPIIVKEFDFLRNKETIQEFNYKYEYY